MRYSILTHFSTDRRIHSRAPRFPNPIVIDVCLLAQWGRITSTSQLISVTRTALQQPLQEPHLRPPRSGTLVSSPEHERGSNARDLE